MAQPVYSLQYSHLKSVDFANAAGTGKYLESEDIQWKPFLEFADGQRNVTLERQNYGTHSFEGSSSIFRQLASNLEDTDRFNSLTTRYEKLAIPPPSSDITGKLILGLFHNDRTAEAFEVFAWFISLDARFRPGRPSDEAFIKRGFALYQSALAVEALPNGKMTAQKVAASAKISQAHLEALGSEVIAAQTINADHSANLEAFRQTLVETANSWWKRYRRIRKFLFSSERNRLKKNDELVQKLVKRSEDSQAEFRRMAIEFGQTTSVTQTERQAQHDALLKLMQEQFRFKAPVELWDGRAKDHSTASEVALNRFLGLGAFTILVAALVPFFFGNYIAGSFHACGLTAQNGCVDGFSAKGPLTVGGLLLIMSVLMWAVRLQYRIFLSERHLSLDASEKMAFAQTYLALKSESQVDSGSEAIVLAALFRPTQDGIIKDDEGGLDFSAASILAKQFSKPN